MRERRDMAAKKGQPWPFVPATAAAFASRSLCVLASSGSVVLDCAKKVPLPKGTPEDARASAVVGAACGLGRAMHAVLGGVTEVDARSHLFRVTYMGPLQRCALVVYSSRRWS